MIVEVFFRGSNFKKLYDTFWNVEKIHRSGHHFILYREKDTGYEEDNVYLDTEKYELRVRY